MPTRYRFKSQEELQAEEQVTWGPRSLLTSDPLAIYVRQSNMAMVKSHRISHELQSKDFIEYAMKLGWRRELIEIYDDTGLTAVLGINDRDRLLDLYEDIKSGHIKTVLIYMVDRLFRDEFLTEATRFGKTCAQNGAMLLTYYGQVYDMQDNRDYQNFILECQWAYHTYKNSILRRMNDLRAIAGKRGEYDGRSLAWGFMRDPEIEYKILVYEPHAKVVRERLAPRYIELDFNLNKLAREFDGIDLFPPIPPHLARLFHTPKKPEPNGWYRLGKHALGNALCNPMYIGWWGYLGHWIKDHHPTVLDEDTFWTVFYRISPVDVDGTSIVRMKRYEQAGTEECPALLKRLLEGEEQGESVTTYPDRRQGDEIVQWGYKLFDSAYSHNRKLLANIQAPVLDDAVVEHLLELLKDQRALEDYHSRMQQQAKAKERRKNSLQDELDDIKKGLDSAFRIMSDPEVDQDAYDQARHMRHKLLARQSEVEAELRKEHPIEKLRKEHLAEKVARRHVLSYPELLKKVGERWHSGIFTVADRRQLLEEFAEKVTMRKLSAHFFRIRIHWQITQQPEELLLWYPDGDRPHWTEEDEWQLQEHYPDKEQLLALFPHRSWGGITRHARDIGLAPGYRKARYLPLEDLLTRQDREVMEAYAVSLVEVPRGKPVCLHHNG